MQKEESKDMIIFTIVFIAILVVAGIFMIKNGFGTRTQKIDQVVLPDQEPIVKENTQEKTTKETPVATPEVSQKPAGKYTKAEMVLETGKKYQAILKTAKGNITVDLFADKTPITVNNFVFLAQQKFYDGIKFHRIVKGFMIQGGDPQGTGMGGPGYSFKDEPFTGDYTAGTIAMANSGPNTNGSQFFIMHKETELPKNYVIFGKVADDKSLAVVDAIAQSPVQVGPSGENSSPIQDIVINSFEIVTK